MSGVFVAIACGSADAHFNPAVTLGFAISSGNFLKFGPCLLAQMLGAFAGAALVWLHYWPHWKGTPESLEAGLSGPAIRRAFSNLISEIVTTLVLVFVLIGIFWKAVGGAGLAAGLGPHLVRSLMWGIDLSLGGTTGYAINPARDLGTRLAPAVLPIAEKGGSDWTYAPVPVIGPLLGGTLAGLLIRSFNTSRSRKPGE